MLKLNIAHATAAAAALSKFM